MDTDDELTTEEEEILEEISAPTKVTGGVVRGHKAKQDATKYIFIGWVAFVAIWLFFFASYFTDVWQNIAVVFSSFLIAGGAVAMLWSPRQWRIRLTVGLGVGWIVFLVLWWAFFAAYFELSLSKNLAVMLTSFLVMSLTIMGAWYTKPGANVEPSDRRGKGSLATILGWLFFLDYYLWFQAESYAANVDITVVLVSTLIAFLLITGIFSSELRKSRRGLMGPGLFALWLSILSVWFYFFSPVIDNIYQNLAIILISILLIAGAAAAIVKKDWRDFERLDWD